MLSHGSWVTPASGSYVISFRVQPRYDGRITFDLLVDGRTKWSAYSE